MEEFEKFQNSVISAFAEEGIELLLPLAADFFLSSSESDDEESTSHASHPHADLQEQHPLNDPNALKDKYKESFRIMETSTLNNHSQRQLYKERALFDALRSGPASEVSGGIRYVDVRTVTLEGFKSEYVVNGGRPAMLQGVVEDGNWPAAHKWSSVEAFLKHYGEIPLKVMEKRPEHGMGRPFLVRIPLLLYKEYADHQNADDPFYAFEPDLDEQRRVFLSDYKQPCYFKEDLYNLDDQTREFYPNYKHLIIGCERTGTNLHVDPKCTGAWNTLLVGHKKWAMFPPGTDEKYLEELGTKAYSKTPATYWWQDIAPKLRKDIGMVECIQRPGETIFVPSGWWHCVLNLDFTIAITENLLIPETLGDVWVDLSSGWPKFTEYLEEKYPHIVGSISKGQPDKPKIITSALTY